MSRIRLRAIALCLGVLLVPTPGRAQVASGSLRGELLAVIARTPDPETGTQQITGLAALTALEVSNTPLGTSTPGILYTFDRQLGTFIRSSQSFGPLFAERSATAGKGRVSVNFN